MQLSVVILNYNVRYFLELCIKSVQAAIQDINAEIIVVDNNSADDSCKMVTQVFPDITLITNKENVGFSKANNQAVILAEGEYVCILNPDTVVAEDTFQKLLDWSTTQEQLGIVGCRLIDGSGAFLPESKRNIPTPAISLKKMLGNSSEYYAQVAEDAIAEVPVLVGAFMFLKREVYNQVKGFDEDYFMYGEDIDISYKVSKAGYKNYYFGKTTVIHFKGESTLKDKTYAKRFYEAMHIFYRKHFEKNIIFDCLVAIGIHVIPFLKKISSSKSKPTNKVKKVLDNHQLSYKEIIEEVEKQTHRYRILPANSNFVTGSDSSESRGEVELLK
ncbi:MAG: glycosyltransferase family 2 protein [Flavobacteriaceae bacterium]|nr:glycosyltransferase family 2 protein [Flavobacteriaceae bacterium]